MARCKYMALNFLILFFAASAEMFSVDVIYSDNTPCGEDKLLELLPRSN